jgi:hypothetical protein
MLNFHNPQLGNYIENLVENNKLRWTYLRDSRRIKIGCMTVHFVEDENGENQMMIGWSKVNRSTIDKDGNHKEPDVFQADIGIARAVRRAVPVDDFLTLWEEGKLPHVPTCWKVARDENGKVVPNSYDLYDQYEAFIDRIEEIQDKLNPQILS